MELVVTGSVIHRSEKRSGVSTKNGNSWSSIEYVVEETSERYPKKVCFTIFGDEKVQNAMQNLHQNDIVTVHCDVDSTEYQGRYFNKINAWKIVKGNVDVFSGNVISANAPQVAPTAAPQQTQQADTNENPFGNTDQDVPF